MLSLKSINLLVYYMRGFWFGFFFHILYAFTLEFTNVFESAVKSICNLLCRYINYSSHFESDCILRCPLYLMRLPVSLTLAMTLAAGSLLCSAFSEQIAQTKCLHRFKTTCLTRNTFQKSRERKKQVESNPKHMETERRQVFLIQVWISRNNVYCKTLLRYYE